MDENNTAGGLSEAEQAYFDSEGATHFEAEDNAETQAQTEADLSKTGVLTDEAAQKAVEGDEEGVRDEKGRFVNYGALHKERSQRRELEAKVSELEQFKAAMAEKMRWTEALLAPEQKKEEAPPDPEQDIFSALKYEREKRLALEAKIEGQEKQTQEQAAATEFEGKVWNYWHQSAAEYKTQTPDFEDAVKWMSETRTNQLKALGKLQPQFSTDAGIVKQINAELFEINVAAAQSGISPAEYIYNMAKAWGYQGKAPVAETNGKIELPGKLKNVEQAQERSRTVAQAPGRTDGTDEISIESLAAMPQGEFNEWMKVPANEKTFKRLMGG